MQRSGVPPDPSFYSTCSVETQTLAVCPGCELCLVPAPPPLLLGLSHCSVVLLLQSMAELPAPASPTEWPVQGRSCSFGSWPTASEELDGLVNSLRGVSRQEPEVTLPKVGLKDMKSSPTVLGNTSLKSLFAGEEDFSLDLVTGWPFPGDTIMLDTSELSTISWLNLLNTTKGLRATSICPFPSALELCEWELQSEGGVSGQNARPPRISEPSFSAGWLWPCESNASTDN